MKSNETISRTDLAVVLKIAAERNARDATDEHISIEQAERVAAEVGISVADFRAALRAVRSRSTTRDGITGPDSTLAAETVIPTPVSEARAAQMLARAQFEIPTAGGAIENPAAGLWRLRTGTTLLQVSIHGGDTIIAAALNRRPTKLTLYAGGMLAGVTVGAVAVGSVVAIPLSLLGLDQFNTSMIANVAALVGGPTLGVLVGRAGWRSAAKRQQQRVLAALECMQAVAEDTRDNTTHDAQRGNA